MKWISIYDQLPELLKDVLLYSKKYGIGIGCLNNDRKPRKSEWLFGEKYGAEIIDNDYCEEDEMVIYWMPLPEKPE